MLCVACSDEDGVLTQEGGDRLSLLYSLGSQQPVTRMADDVVQANGNFRGLSNLILIPFQVNHGLDRPVVGSQDDNNISRLGAFGYTDLKTFMYAPSQSWLNDIYGSGLWGTKAFLGYGKVNADADEDTPQKRFANGVLRPTGLTLGDADCGKPTAIGFHLVPIYEGTAEGTVGATLAALLTSLAQTRYSGTTMKENPPSDEPGYHAEKYTSTWAEVSDSRPIKTLFNQFTSLRAGSSDAIETVLASLHSQLRAAKQAKDAGRMDYNYSVEVITSENREYTGDDLVESILQIFANYADATYPVIDLSGGTLKLTENYKGYPASVNMPAGAAYVSFNTKTSVFTAGISSIAGSEAEAGENDLNSFVYPPSLFYRLNSPVVTSMERLKPYYESGSRWSGGTSSVLAHFQPASTDQEIGRYTLSAAIEQPLHYAVARLDLTVALSNRELEDSRNETRETYDGFPITGLLIGAQQDVNWEFKPTGKSGAEALTIYTKVNSMASANASSNTTMRTLVLETYPNDVVVMAVEMTNTTGSPFYGVDQMEIPAGSPFYMLAALNPATATTEQTDGDQADKTRVFTQDQITEVNCVVHNLKNAYLNIPDLRNAGLKIGLQVNTDWQSGISKDTIIK